MNCVVVKLGGHALDSLSPTSTVLVDLAHDVSQLRDDGVNVVVDGVADQPFHRREG